MYFFSKKPNPPVLGFPFKTDVHAHLIPGIDDGPSTIQESIAMIQKLYDLGYRTLTATPHVFSDFYPNSSQQILDGLSYLQKEVASAGIPIKIKGGAEYFLDQAFEELLDTEPLLTINDNLLLIEMSSYGAPLNLYEIIQKIRQKGYQPVLAHPERYVFLTNSDYEKLLLAGCLFQLNIMSVQGYYGKYVQKQAFRLIKNDCTHFIGTDAHSLAHVELITKLVGTKFFNQLSLHHT